MPFVAALAIFASACGDGAGSPPEADAGDEPSAALVESYQAMMNLHDDVMPMAAEVARTERALTEGSVDVDQAAFAKTRLARAGDAMDAWMHNYEPLEAIYTRLGAATTAEHLRIREKEIRTIGDSLRASIDYGQSLLK